MTSLIHTSETARNHERIMTKMYDDRFDPRSDNDRYQHDDGAGQQQPRHHPAISKPEDSSTTMANCAEAKHNEDQYDASIGLMQWLRIAENEFRHRSLMEPAHAIEYQLVRGSDGLVYHIPVEYDDNEEEGGCFYYEEEEEEYERKSDDDRTLTSENNTAAAQQQRQ